MRKICKRIVVDIVISKAKAIILVVALLMFCNEGVQAQVYLIKDYTRPIEVDGIQKKRGDYIHHTDAITWKYRGNESVTVIGPYEKYYKITRLGYKEVEAKNIGDYIVQARPLKTKGISPNEKQAYGIICVDTVIPQISICKIDSIKCNEERYYVVYKGGKCGIYDSKTDKNITFINYIYLHYLFRKEESGRLFTYFAWEDVDKLGVIEIIDDKCSIITFPKEK